MPEARLPNVNVGVMGHVDAGKTTLARVLSAIPSTACFDKSPQSVSRGITLDLGFSSLFLPGVQVSLVDCPGHASLFRMVIGAASIIDAIILVVDGRAGIQVQTAECLALAEIVTERLLVVISKVDLTTDQGEEMGRRVLKTIQRTTKFKKIIMARFSEKIPESRAAVLQALEELVSPPQRDCSSPVLIAVDHCFALKQRGGGSVMTGTILQGKVQLGDVLETPTLGPSLPVKIKSIQSFHHVLSSAAQGDRVGLNVGPLGGTKKMERTVLATPGSLLPARAIMISVNRVRHYKGALGSGSKFHLSLLHETAIVTATFARRIDGTEEYEYLPGPEQDDDDNCVAFLTLASTSPIYTRTDSLAVLSRLDLDASGRVCRLAFYGKVASVLSPADMDRLRLFKWKHRRGRVDRLISSTRLIGRDLCATVMGLRRLVGEPCQVVSEQTGSDQTGSEQTGSEQTGSGQTDSDQLGSHQATFKDAGATKPPAGAVLAHGVIESTFGTSGKFNVTLSSPLLPSNSSPRVIRVQTKQFIALYT